jgi:hypothetical protein
LIIEAEGKNAGKMRVSELNGEAWIYGFAYFRNSREKGLEEKPCQRW